MEKLYDSSISRAPTFELYTERTNGQEYNE